MSNLKVKNLVQSLEKWLKVCIVLENKKEEDIITSAIGYLEEYKELNLSEIMIRSNKDSEKEIQKKNKKKSKTTKENRELIASYINYFNRKDKEMFTNLSFKFINIEEDINITWRNCTRKEKEEITKLELNLIYNIIYKFNEVKYLEKKKELIINDIDEYIKNMNRNNAIDNLPVSKL